MYIIALEELAKRGNVSCKKTLNDTHRIHHKRNTFLDHLLQREIFEANGDHFIYDSQNQYKQRANLSREEGGEAVIDNVMN